MNIILTIFCLFSIYNFFVQSQSIDTNFCDINTIPADPDNLPVPKVVNSTSYQAWVEKNIDTKEFTEEIFEYYDVKNDVGIALTRTPIAIAKTYSYYKTNELLLIINGTCGVFKLNESYQLTPFFLVVIDGQELIVSPLSLLFSSERIQFVYIGSSNFVRGIPVNQWQTCYYNTDSVQRITYSFTDPKKWSPASFIPDGSEPITVPIQVVIETKFISGKIETETYSITEFKSNPNVEEESFFTPPGIFCPNRLSSLFIPELPKSFEITREIVIPSNSIEGFRTSLRENYDFEFELFQFGYYNESSRYSAIHDFKTGLEYKFDLATGNCEVAKLSDTLKDENIYFDFNSVNNYQYTGKRRVDGVNTDVWIGEKMFKGEKTLFEWCFLADGWTRPDQYGDNSSPTPILLTIYFSSPDPLNPSKIRNPEYHHFYNYHPINSILLSHDISKCSNAVGKRRFSFTIPRENGGNIDKYRPLFQVAAIKTLQKIAQVTILRISNIETFVDQDGVYVLFSIFEKSSFYGNSVPEQDVTLDVAVENLKQAFKKQFDIQFETNDFLGIGFYVNKNSLTEINPNQEGYIAITKMIYKQGFVSGDVAAVTIITTLCGLLVSVLLVLLHKFKKIKLPLLPAV